MTCIVLTKNPSGGGIVALSDGDEGEIARWQDPIGARIDAETHPLIKAWGGWVVDLDKLEVNEL